MAAYDPQGYRQFRQRRLQEQQVRMQNDPGRIFLKAMAQAAPQATFNALGQMAVRATDYYGLGGKDKFEEQKRATRASESIQSRRNDLAQQTNELNTIKSLGSGSTRNRLIRDYIKKYGTSPPGVSATPSKKESAPMASKDQAKAKTDLPKPTGSKPAAQKPVEKNYYVGLAEQAMRLQEGDERLAGESAQVTRTAQRLQKAAEEDRKELFNRFEKRLKNFQESSVQLGSVLRKSKGKDKQAAIDSYNKKTEGFINSFLDEVKMLPKPEQVKALASVRTILKSGGVPDAARAAFDARAVAIGMSVPQGYKGRTPRPGPTLGERTSVLRGAKDSQKEADNARRQAQAARAAGNEEQAKQLETRADRLQSSAVSQAEASKFKGAVVNGRVVVGVDKPATEAGKKAVDIATEYYGAEGAVQNKSAALKKAAQEAGYNAQQISDMINAWNDLPGDSEKDAVFNELYNSLDEVLFSDLESFTNLPKDKQAYISKKLSIYTPEAAKKLFMMMNQDATIKDLTNKTLDSLFEQQAIKLNQ